MIQTLSYSRGTLSEGSVSRVPSALKRDDADGHHKREFPEGAQKPETRRLDSKLALLVLIKLNVYTVDWFVFTWPCPSLN